MAGPVSRVSRVAMDGMDDSDRDENFGAPDVAGVVFPLTEFSGWEALSHQSVTLDGPGGVVALTGRIEIASIRWLPMENDPAFMCVQPIWPITLVGFKSRPFSRLIGSYIGLKGDAERSADEILRNWRRNWTIDIVTKVVHCL